MYVLGLLRDSTRATNSIVLRRGIFLDHQRLQPLRSVVCVATVVKRPTKSIDLEIDIPRKSKVIRSRRKGEVLLLYLQSHIRDRIYESPYTSQGIDYTLITLDEI